MKLDYWNRRLDFSHRKNKLLCRLLPKALLLLCNVCMILEQIKYYVFECWQKMLHICRRFSIVYHVALRNYKNAFFHNLLYYSIWLISTSFRGMRFLVAKNRINSLQVIFYMDCIQAFQLKVKHDWGSKLDLAFVRNNCQNNFSWIEMKEQRHNGNFSFEWSL